MAMLATCYSCKQVMACNPSLVPCLPASVTPTGEKEPVCRSCIERANPDRIRKGLAPISILPGAYESEEVA